jgi:predicted NAD-dependent protein-ADP-ribosyltransferase YbiA (DUF1768 family)
MKLFNVVIIHDVFVVGDNPEKAREAVLAAIREGTSPTEMTALEARSESNIRQSWREQKPYVAADISDADFEKVVKGHTTIEMFKQIYTKQPGAKK